MLKNITLEWRHILMLEWSNDIKENNVVVIIMLAINTYNVICYSKNNVLNDNAGNEYI